MKCPTCGYPESHVIDSRSIGDGIRRRRQCDKCQMRFTTIERPQPKTLFIEKKDGRREEYNRDKLLSGIRKACEKRSLPTGTLDKIVDNIETELFGLTRNEITSSLIGDMVISRLEELDPVAYIRFASVYQDFNDISSFKQAVDRILETTAKAPLSGQLSFLSNKDIIAMNRQQRRSK